MKLKLMEFVANHTILAMVIGVFGIFALLPLVLSIFGVAMSVVFTLIKFGIKVAFFGAIAYGIYKLIKKYLP